MNTVAKIIETYGGLEWLRKPGNYIRLENPPYMRLVIEYVGDGPRGMPAIAVAHYYEPNGAAMRDPEIVFEVNQDEDGPLSWKRGEWASVSFRQDSLDVYQDAVFLGDNDCVEQARPVHLRSRCELYFALPSPLPLPNATILEPAAAYSRPLATAIGWKPGIGVVHSVSSVLGASATTPSLAEAKITLLLATNRPHPSLKGRSLRILPVWASSQ